MSSVVVTCVASAVTYRYTPSMLRPYLACLQTLLATYLLCSKANIFAHGVVSIEREVKKATRDLTNLLTGIETPLSRLDLLQAKYTELLGRMKRLDQENAKNKKRGDLFQKEKEAQRTELSKTVSMKEKLEKLCRELTKENKKVKVRLASFYILKSTVCDCILVKSNPVKPVLFCPIIVNTVFLHLCRMQSRVLFQCLPMVHILT